MNEQIQKGRSLRDQVGHILHFEWDPIGVSELPEAEGEYESYVGPIVAMIVNRDTRERIVDHLLWIVTNLMQLSGDRGHAETIADRLITLRNSFEDDGCAGPDRCTAG